MAKGRHSLRLTETDFAGVNALRAAMSTDVVKATESLVLRELVETGLPILLSRYGLTVAPVDEAERKSRAKKDEVTP